jgi:DNA-3-methyladenine glycosylase II
MFDYAPCIQHGSKNISPAEDFNRARLFQTGYTQLIFSLGREDVFPVGDLGVRKGMARLFDLDVEDRAEMVERAERWRPYRTYATLYCWRVEEDIADSVAEVVGE